MASERSPRPARPRRRHAASATRILVSGLATAATITLVTILGLDAPPMSTAAPVPAVSATLPPTQTVQTLDGGTLVVPGAPPSGTGGTASPGVVGNAAKAISGGSATPPTSGGSAAGPAPAPVPSAVPAPVPAPAPAPAPAPSTGTGGS